MSDRRSKNRFTTRRRMLIAMGVSIFSSLAAIAQQKKVPRIGVLSTSPLSGVNANPNVLALVQGLQELGYVEGYNAFIERRSAEGDAERFPALAADLVKQKVDVIVTYSSVGTRAAKQVAGMTPIVFVTLTDPVGQGFIASLARPGANITGLTGIGTDLTAKRAQLLKEAFPQIARMAVFITDATVSRYMEEVQRAANALRIQILAVNTKEPYDLKRGFAQVREWRADSMYVIDDSVNFANRVALAKFSLTDRLPAIYPTKAYVDAGGLMSYGPDYPDLSRRAATYIDKILKGTKPGDLPVEQPSTFEFVINAKTAKMLGVIFPGSILVQATTVIE